MPQTARELVWLNGSVLPLAEASISLEDRGFQFADGVYEVIRLYDGVPFTLAEHLERLEKSAAGISIRLKLSRDQLDDAIRQFLPQTGIAQGMIYLQVTRGVAARNHAFPKRAEPTVLFYARELPPPNEPGGGEGQKLITVNDERWKRCWIKSIALLANVLAKNEALDAGADEAAFVEDGIVSECSASNLFAVIGGAVVTHPVGPKVLPGITRLVLSQLARESGVPFVERPMRIEEAKGADELFITSTTRELNWVGRWDGENVGTGRCGEVTKRLHEGYVARVLSEVRANGSLIAVGGSSGF